MGAQQSKSNATSATSAPTPPWAALTPKLVLLIFRRLCSHGDRVSVASVCRHWRHISKRHMRWSDLPPKLAALIVRRLSDDADRVLFASVCRHWRDVATKFWSPWSCLPPELACLVLHRLVYSHAGRVRFAAVCRNWRYVARHWQYSPPLPPALPWLCTDFGIFQSLPDGKLHRYLRSRERKLCRGSFINQILFQEVDSGSWFLENPLSGAKVPLPRYCNEPVYLHVYIDGLHKSPSRYSTCFNIHKVIMCTGGLIAAIVSFRYLLQSQAIACYRPRRPGMSSWSIGLSNPARYKDIAFHLGKLYAVANGGDLFVHEVTEDSRTVEPILTRIEQVIQVPPRMDGFYWVSEEKTDATL